MKHRLIGCPSCARHVRADERSCPFCRRALPDGFDREPAPSPPPLRTRQDLYRAGARLLGSTGAIATLAAVAACSSANSLPTAAYGAVTFAPCEVPTSCSGEVYFEVPATDCGEENCTGSSAYAICGGSSYSECSCSIPAGWKRVTGAACEDSPSGDAPDDHR